MPSITDDARYSLELQYIQTVSLTMQCSSLCVYPDSVWFDEWKFQMMLAGFELEIHSGSPINPRVSLPVSKANILRL